MTITGDVTTVAQVGDNYRIEMTTPSGSDRDDGVFLNVYIDEYDCDDDPNLKHNLTILVCAQLRLKVIQTIYIQEGAETMSDYVDSDGNQHYVFEIARIHRYDGVDAIWDIDDLRPILNDGSSSYSSLYILSNNLRVVPTIPEANTVDVLPGWWTLSDRSALKKFPTRTTSPVFAPITTPGNVRYDLISLADNSTLSVVTGTEVAFPGDPFLDGPPPEGNKLALAFVRITETGTVLVDREDITDAREFLNIGLGTDALSNYYAALWLRPHEQDTPDNTLRIEPGRYMNSNRTQVINKTTAFNSGVFSPVSAGGNVRYDLVSMDNSGNPQIKQGSEVVAPGNPYTDAPIPDVDKLVVAIVKVDETATVVVDDTDVYDAREFLNLGGGGVAIEKEIREFHPDASDPAINTMLWNVSPAVLFGSAADTAVWLDFEKPEDWGSVNIDFRLSESPDTNGGGSDTVRLKMSYWVLSDGETFNIGSPDATNQEDLDVSAEVQDNIYWHNLPNLRIVSSDVPADRCKIIAKVWRDTAVANNFGGGFRLSTMVAYL
jgi:hypothetical protein